jgi:hypothetical protein
MSLNWNDLRAAEEHRAKLLREAAQARLVHEALASRQRRNTGVRARVEQIRRLLHWPWGRRPYPEAAICPAEE